MGVGSDTMACMGFVKIFGVCETASALIVSFGGRPHQARSTETRLGCASGVVGRIVEERISSSSWDAPFV